MEAAHFVPEVVARAGRRHKVTSEAGRRNERGVDRDLAPYASARAAALLLEFGGGHYVGMTAVETPAAPVVIALPLSEPGDVAGMEIPRATVVTLLEAIGCEVDEADEGQALVSPPSWRPDLTDAIDLVEEVIRLNGYDLLPSTLPAAPLGRGLTRGQRLRRRVGMVLASRGMVEVLTYPFVGPAELDALRLPEDDTRRVTPRLANPLSEEQPYLRGTLLPGLISVVRRNTGRGLTDVSVFEIGAVFVGDVAVESPVRPPVHRRPSAAEWQDLNDLLPHQPTQVAAVLSGHLEPEGWWGPARPAIWSDAIEVARMVAEACGVELEVSAGDDPAFHPGRCAALSVGELRVGAAGELHPRVVESNGLAERTSAMWLDLDAVIHAAPDVRPAPQVGTQPLAKEDLAVVVDRAVPVAEVLVAAP